MAPKKKGNKKAQQDDWEAELGETVAPAGTESPKAEEAPAAAEEDAGFGGGLMASLQRRKQKKGKKNQNDDWEAELGEDAPGQNNGAESPAPLESKAPQEGSLEDEDDVFAGNYGKKKGKAQDNKKKEEPKVEEKKDDAPRVKTKAEKEREKKEKEKQRKKEMVG